MTDATTWHVDERSAVRYAMADTDPVTAASIDAHLMVCEQCRAMVARFADTDLLASIWDDVAGVLDQPQIGWVERILRRIGCSDSVSRIISASTRAQLSFLMVVAVSVALAILSSVSASEVDNAFGLFLIVAPLGPLAATASAFSRWTDPTYALTRTLPVSTWKIILVRTIAAVVPAIVLTAASTPWLLDRGWMSAAWLLPSLALAAVVLALSSWVDIEIATVGVALAWLAFPVALHIRSTSILQAFAGPVQPAAAVALVCGAGLTLVRRTHFEYGRF
jgi:hypothetical protein